MCQVDYIFFPRCAHQITIIKDTCGKATFVTRPIIKTELARGMVSGTGIKSTSTPLKRMLKKKKRSPKKGKTAHVASAREHTSSSIPNYDSLWSEHYPLPPRIRTRTKSQDIFLSGRPTWQTTSNLIARATSFPCLTAKEEIGNLLAALSNDKNSALEELDDEDVNEVETDLLPASADKQLTCGQKPSCNRVDRLEEIPTKQQLGSSNEHWMQEPRNDKDDEVLIMQESVATQQVQESHINSGHLSRPVQLRIDTSFQQVFSCSEMSPDQSSYSTEPFPSFEDSLPNSSPPAGPSEHESRSERTLNNAQTGLGILPGTDNEDTVPLLPHERVQVTLRVSLQPARNMDTHNSREDTVYLNSLDGINMPIQVLRVENHTSSDNTNSNLFSAYRSKPADSDDCLKSADGDSERSHIPRPHGNSDLTGQEPVNSGSSMSKTGSPLFRSKIHLSDETDAEIVNGGDQPVNGCEEYYQGPVAKSTGKEIKGTLSAQNSAGKGPQIDPVSTDAHDTYRWAPAKTVVSMEPPRYKKDWLERLGRKPDLKDVITPETPNFDLRTISFADAVREKAKVTSPSSAARKATEDAKYPPKPKQISGRKSSAIHEPAVLIHREEPQFIAGEGFTTVKSRKEVRFRMKVQRPGQGTEGLGVTKPSAASRTARIDFSKVDFGELNAKPVPGGRRESITQASFRSEGVPMIQVPIFISGQADSIGLPSAEESSMPLRQHLDPSVLVSDWSDIASTNSSVLSFKTALESVETSPVASRDPSPSPSSRSTGKNLQDTNDSGSSARDRQSDEIYLDCFEYFSPSVTLADTCLVSEEDIISNETENDGSTTTPTESNTSFDSDLTVKPLENEDDRAESAEARMMRASVNSETRAGSINKKTTRVVEKQNYQSGSMNHQKLRTIVIEGASTPSTYWEATNGLREQDAAFGSTKCLEKYAPENQENASKPADHERKSNMESPKNVSPCELSVESTIGLMSARRGEESTKTCIRHDATNADTLSPLRDWYLPNRQAGHRTRAGGISSPEKPARNSRAKEKVEFEDEDPSGNATYAAELAEARQGKKRATSFDNYPLGSYHDVIVAMDGAVSKSQVPADTAPSETEEQEPKVHHQKADGKVQSLHVAMKSAESNHKPRGKKGTQRFRKTKPQQNVADYPSNVGASFKGTEKSYANLECGSLQSPNVLPAQSSFQHDLGNSIIPSANSPFVGLAYPTLVPISSYSASPATLAPTNVAMTTPLTSNCPKKANKQQPTMWLDFYGGTHSSKPAYPKYYMVNNVWVPIPASQRVLPPGWTDEEVSIQAENRSRLQRSSRRSMKYSGRRAPENVDKLPANTSAQLQRPRHQTQSRVSTQQTQPVLGTSQRASTLSVQRRLHHSEPYVPKEEIIGFIPCGKYTIVSASVNFLMKCPDCDPDTHYE